MADFWSGKDVRVILRQDSETIPVDVISWTCKPNGVKAADGVCGEDRDRLQFIVNYYELTLTCKQQAAAAVSAFLVSQANLDAQVADFTRSVQMRIRPLDGTSRAFQATAVTLDDWEFSAAGRTERNALSVPLRAKYFTSQQSL